MTTPELEALIEEIRNGRPEDASLEWKRQWWNLSTETGKDEFRRDVAAMANSAVGCGRFIIGLKDGRITDSPLPQDEAQLQQLLRTITPLPSVHFEQLTFENKAISVIAVLPPLNRPYVLNLKDQNLIFLRRGSQTGTATRFDLDRFYSQKQPCPSLGARWAHWSLEQLVNRGNPTISDTLIVCSPPVRAPEVIEYYRRQLEAGAHNSEETRHLTREHLAEFERGLRAFEASLADEANLIYWYLDQPWARSLASTPGVQLVNTGSAPASTVKLRVAFPNWLWLGEGKLPQPPGYVTPPRFPARPPKASLNEMIMGFNQHTRLENLMPGLVIPDFARQRVRGVSEERPSQATFWADKVLHGHDVVIDETVSVLALPTASLPTSPVSVTAEIFCEEQENWRPLALGIELVPAPGDLYDLLPKTF